MSFGPQPAVVKARRRRPPARASGATMPAAFADMTDDQLRALDAAVNGTGIQIEVVVGPTARIGAEGHHASSVMSDLRTEISDVMGHHALVTRADGPERVSQALADEATRAALP